MTIIKSLTAFGLLLLASPALAEQSTAHGGHGSQLFHAFQLEADWADTDEGDLVTWDAHGWVGGDQNKAVLKSEGEHHGDEWEQAELWGLYSRNISDFWDAQVGVRQDFIPHARTYFTAGMQGMMPHFIEAEAYFFVSDLGDVSARVEGDIDINLTQRLITTPHAEMNFFAQDVPEKSVKAGLANVELGIQTRYEFMRELAPYVDINYERLVGGTSSLATTQGKDNDSLTIRTGLKIWF
jgi:copper resistance protein B